MEKNTKYFLIALILLTLAIAGYRYDQYVVEKNFVIEVNTSCSVGELNCFVASCAAGEEGCDKTPYKKVTIKDFEAPQCLEEHTCQDFSCDGKASCSAAYCSEDSLADGEECLK